MVPAMMFRSVRSLFTPTFPLTSGKESFGTLPMARYTGILYAAGEEGIELPWRWHDIRENVKPRHSDAAVCTKHT